MERVEYKRLAQAEERMWWFRGLHANLIAALAHGALPSQPPRILDAGCGTGGLLARLARAFPHALLVGLELDRGAAATAREKSGQSISVGSVDRLPFDAHAFDAIVSADVLCHRGVDEAGALAEFSRCLRPRGVVVLNLPAYRWLHSAHDRAVDNARRYGRREVAGMLSAAGFGTVRAGYWNTFLFPLMVLRRKLGPRARSGSPSDVAILPAPLEAVFAALLALETRLREAGVGFPFGGSILAVARKQ